MEFHIFEDDLTLATIPNVTPRISVRAVIIRNNNLLLIHNQAIDTYVLPGGGVEDSETLEDALKREVLEETGYTVIEATKTFCVKEYFSDSIWHHHYYRVDVSSDYVHPKLTVEEIALGHTITEKPIVEALDMLSHYQGKHPNSNNIHQRELIGLIHSL